MRVEDLQGLAPDFYDYDLGAVRLENGKTIRENQLILEKKVRQENENREVKLTEEELNNIFVSIFRELVFSIDDYDLLEGLGIIALERNRYKK